MFLFRADAARDLAEVAGRVGAREEAARARAVALELYRAKGNLAAAAQPRPVAQPVEDAGEHGDERDRRQHEQLELQPLPFEARRQRGVRVGGAESRPQQAQR